MNTRALHKALMYVMIHAVWDKPNGNEWKYIGDGSEYDDKRLQPLAKAWFKSDRLVVSVDRELAFEGDRPSLTATLNKFRGVHGGVFGGAGVRS